MAKTKEMRSFERELNEMPFHEYFKKVNGWDILNKTLNLVCGYPKDKQPFSVLRSRSTGVAATNFTKVLYNPDNALIRSLLEEFEKAQKEEDYEKREELRKKIILAKMGFISHEGGHICFSDFKSYSKIMDGLQTGSILIKPDIEFINEVDEKYFNILVKLIDKSTHSRKVLMRFYQFVDNTIDDEWMENKVMEQFHGDVKTALLLDKKLLREQSGDTVKMEKLGPVEIICNLILHSVRLGQTDVAKGIFEDFMAEIQSTLEKAVATDDYLQRCAYIFAIISHSLPITRKQFNPPKKKSGDEKSDLSEKSESSSSETSPSSEDSEESSLDLEEGEDDDFDMSTSEEIGDMFDDIFDDDFEEDEEASQEMLDSLDDSLDGESLDEKTEMAKDKDFQDMVDETRKEATENNDLEGSLEEEFTKAEKKLFDSSIKEQLKKKLKKEALNVKLHPIHNRADWEIIINEFDKLQDEVGYESRWTTYRELQEKNDRIIKDLKKQLAPLFIEDNFVEEGVYFGNRLCEKHLSDAEGKMMMRDDLPSDNRKLAIQILVDQSGSMISCDRDMFSRDAAMVLYEVCKELNIPISIWGHGVPYGNSFWGRTVLPVFCDFDNHEKENEERIAKMTTNSCDNRDGLAIALAGNHLARREEEHKLFIILSDGEPADYTSKKAVEYSGVDGKVKEDITQTLSQLKRQGVTTFVAAIGSDKDQLLELYGQNKFLDITDLSKMPKVLTRLIQRQVV